MVNESNQRTLNKVMVELKDENERSPSKGVKSGGENFLDESYSRNPKNSIRQSNPKNHLKH